jgi:SAM-dependent methyltransferase
LTGQSETPVGDPVGSRQPTSHEQRTGQPWDAFYRDGRAPWDIGRPQPAFSTLASEGALTGAVLDAGCGTGEHALLAASLGLPALGVDVAETALAKAREKAASRSLKAEFETADALHFERLGRKFQTVLDCGLLHTFNASERPEYVASLATITEPGSMLYILCFSDQGSDIGPHPVTEQEIRAAFDSEAGWSVVDLSPNFIHTRFHPDGASAWLAAIKRI